jgi:hypothetical protein
MFIINDPGPWQYYHYRPDNVGLNTSQLKQKFLTEQVLFEQQQYEAYMNWLLVQPSGTPSSEMTTPQVELTTQNGQILQTQNGFDLTLG